MTRHCANPRCRVEITGCNGYFSSEDQLALLTGKSLTIEHSTELCGFCGAILHDLEREEYDDMLARVLGEKEPPPPQFAHGKRALRVFARAISRLTLLPIPAVEPSADPL